MARVTPEEFAEKHARRLKGATEDIRRGVENVTEAPTLKAAAKIDKMKRNLLEAIDSGKVERGLKRVGLEDWKDKMISKGINRIPEGIDAAHDKQVAFASELLPYEDNLKRDVSKMSDLSFEDNVQRMVAWSRGMHKFKRTK